MFLIPGPFIALLTFPGVIVHEFAHQLFCRLTGTAVFDVCYIRFGNPAGYVTHEPPRTAMQHLLIAVGPFFVNTVLGALIGAPAAIPVLTLDAGSPLDYILMWQAVSIAMHAFPSTGDAKSIWAMVKKAETPAGVKLVATPIVGLIYAGAIGSFVW